MNYDGEDEALEDNELDQHDDHRASSEEDGEDIMENMEE